MRPLPLKKVVRAGIGLWPRPPVERTRPLIPLRGGEATLPHSLRSFNTRLLKTGQNKRTKNFYYTGESSVADPDSFWSAWIRIRIGTTDPDPGGPK